MKQWQDFSRVELGIFPTPLQKLEHMSRLFGKNIYLKRDDLSGVALGGNKVRKLEFLLADALQKGAQVVMTTGGAQSNHAMLTAACCNKLGLKAQLLLKKRGVSQMLGNQILNDLLGAEVTFFDTDSYGDIYEEMARRRTAMAEQGITAYEIPVGGSTALGALGYVRCFQEIMDQSAAMGFTPDRVISVVGSGGTYAGLCAGADLYAPGVKVTGMAVDDDPFEQICRQLKMEIGGLLELDRILDGSNLEIFYNCGAGYGIPSHDDGEAVRLMARTEGIIFDPVYTGKAFALFLQMLRQGAFDGEDDLVFLHSGGAGGVFAIELP